MVFGIESGEIKPSEGSFSKRRRAEEEISGSWTSCVRLHRLAWTVKRGVLSSTTTQSNPALAALAAWVGDLKVRVGGEREGVLLCSMDEHLLNWVMESVQSGWTPREVLS